MGTGCNCRINIYLKIYCDCFAGDENCDDECSCEECLNREPIQSQNPHALHPKVQQANEAVVNISVVGGPRCTPSSLGHKRECNCKKSKCSKRDCECPQANTESSRRCQCSGNVYRRKEDNAAKKDIIIKKVNNGTSCNCGVNRCLKMYHGCFGAGGYCDELCYCQGCLNKEPKEDTVDLGRYEIQSRNRHALHPKIRQPNEAIVNSYGVMKRSEILNLVAEVFCMFLRTRLRLSDTAYDFLINRFLKIEPNEDTADLIRYESQSQSPHALHPKIQQTNEAIVNSSGVGGPHLTPSPRHIRDCKKSKCSKSYSDCYQTKVGFSERCQCKGCRNVCGIKEGNAGMKDIVVKKVSDEVSDSSSDEKFEVADAPEFLAFLARMISSTRKRVARLEISVNYLLEVMGVHNPSGEGTSTQSTLLERLAKTETLVQELELKLHNAKARAEQEIGSLSQGVESEKTALELVQADVERIKTDIASALQLVEYIENLIWDMKKDL